MPLKVLGKLWMLHMGQEMLTTFPEHLVLPFSKRSTFIKEIYSTMYASPMILNANFNEAFLNA